MSLVLLASLAVVVLGTGRTPAPEQTVTPEEACEILSDGREHCNPEALPEAASVTASPEVDSLSDIPISELSLEQYYQRLTRTNPQKVWTNNLLNSRREYGCENRISSNHCDAIAAEGRCPDNPRHSIWSCAKSCGYCHLQDLKTRCTRDPEQLPVLKEPGYITSLFERAITDFPQYSPTVLSRDPWVLEFHDLFSKEEAEAFIEHQNFKRSHDTGKMNKEGTSYESIKSSGRTSSNSWCLHGCWNNPLIQDVVARIQNLTLVPGDHSEYFQVLQYFEGQLYNVHHDYIPDHVNLPMGPRIFTFFLYLNDVEEGGHTAFPDLGLSVKPEFGKAVWWPSVRDVKGFPKDGRTTHEAQPPTKGVKYGANMWLHQYNFMEPYTLSCTG